jgi:hypothetical protein
VQAPHGPKYKMLRFGVVSSIDDCIYIPRRFTVSRPLYPSASIIKSSYFLLFMRLRTKAESKTPETQVLCIAGVLSSQVTLFEAGSRSISEPKSNPEI